MIQLRDSILIDVEPGRVWAWLDELPLHYREWHPDHVACRYERGDAMRVGTVLYTEERLHGRLHRLRMRATEVVPGRAIRYRGGGFRGAFLVDSEDGGSRFTAELAFGTRAPIVGDVLDAALRRAMAGRLRAFEVHMREEGENLKALLERKTVA